MAMRRRVGPTRILCINCNICLNNTRRYSSLGLDPRVRAIISSWIYPNIIAENDNVCEACRDLALAAVSGSQEAQPRARGHSNVCCLCGCSIHNRQSDVILRQNPTDIQRSIRNIIQSRVAPREILISDRVCHACWLRVRREVIRTSRHDENRPLQDITNRQDEKNEQPPAPAPPAELAPPAERAQRIVLPQYRRAPNSTHHCVFPNCDSTILMNIHDNFRARILHDEHYYIPKYARVCNYHLNCNSWHTLFSAASSINWFNVQQIEHVFSLVNPFSQTLNFNTINMDDNVFHYWVGLSKLCFTSLIREVPRISQLRRGQVGLAAFLIKMRTGDSDVRLSTLLNIPRRSLELLMDNVREILCQDFVPTYLGINHITHDEFREHNLLIPNGLYGNQNNGIIICDGTYIYTNRSNYIFQKETYSLHKFRNLLKPFLMVASDGYIVDCFGPYKATTSDATIMCNLFRENSALRWYFRENDAFILDRGFRDSIGLLEECGYRAYMPETLLPGEHQLTTAQANRNRCVTICRWVVEVVNGYFKRDFKLLRQTYFNKSLPHMMQNFQIAAALLNKFGVRLRDRINAAEILNIIRNNVNLQNNLSGMVESLNLNRRFAHFRSITAYRDNIYFPRLEETDLILISLGTYQIRQARSYYGEHVRFHGRYRIEVCAERHDFSEYNLRGSDDKKLIRCKIKSRHISRKQYYVYVLIENNVPGRAGIVEHCCSCLVGRRTVGCCSHIMTVIWYLGWARYQQNITAPAGFLDNVTIDDVDIINDDE